MLDPAHLMALLPRAEVEEPVPTCGSGNEYDGRIGLRISAVFVILIGSSLGALFPVWVRPGGGNAKGRMAVPPWAFFIAKYFGSGVIVATAFIHLLAPAEEALKNPCLTGVIVEYPWVEGIMLMTIVLLFFIELMVMRFAHFGSEEIAKELESGTAYHDHDHDHDHGHSHGPVQTPDTKSDSSPAVQSAPKSHLPGEDHLGHTRDHHPASASNTTSEKAASANPHLNHHHSLVEDYSAQLTSIFILEFGIIFHSIFIGLTLAVAGEEFTTLYVVLVFHQTFEGLGLGARLAAIRWPPSKRLTPYILAIAYGLSTPIAIAIGLGVRNSYPPEGRTTLIVNGVFDAVSGGILIYTALVELMAHEFMFSSSMKRAPLSTVLSAFFLLCLGAALMALLGKWA